MKKEKLNFKSIFFTLFLFIICIVLFYSLIGVFVSGSYYKNYDEENKIINLIKKENKEIINIEKNVFKYKTYIAEVENGYIFFDENGDRLGSIEKEDKKIEEVNKYVDEKYPSLKDSEIRIGYGIDSPAYFIEEGYELLVIHFNTLEEIFYMKEGL